MGQSKWPIVRETLSFEKCPQLINMCCKVGIVIKKLIYHTLIRPKRFKLLTFRCTILVFTFKIKFKKLTNPFFKFFFSPRIWMVLFLKIYHFKIPFLIFIFIFPYLQNQSFHNRFLFHSY
jgi:hypothetical protein